ncbi:MAG: hypothetical protein RQ756_06320 [Flavobacteriaceae bacterium]|nr:hypothetical protein [Flavobacteriaceae bacterium]
MKKSGIVFIIGSLLLLSLYQFPLWNITLGAPQYPDPLGMNIFFDGVEGVEEFDIQNIDGVNHYIGMKKVPKKEDMWEFTVFPIFILAMSIFGVLVGLGVFFKKLTHRWIFAWLIIMCACGLFGLFDFNLWLQDYGTDLDPKAIMKLTDADGNQMSYKPPFIGTKHILNFTAHSYPRLGTLFVGLSVLLGVYAWILGKKQAKV